MTQAENKILMEMSEKLGSIASDITTLKNDVSELKQADVKYNARLDEMYDKAMRYAASRQDSIRDALQEQITQNTNDIAKLKGAKGSTLIKWYDRIIDKLIWAALATIGILIIKWAQGGFTA